MRKVYEPTEGCLAQAKKQKPWTSVKWDIPVVCHVCGVEHKVSLNRKRHIDTMNNKIYTCNPCRENGKRELKEAMLNIAKRKAK